MLCKKYLHNLTSDEWTEFTNRFSLNPSLYQQENIFYSMWINNLSIRTLKKIMKEYKFNLFDDEPLSMNKIQETILKWNSKNWKNHHEMLNQCIPLCNQTQLEQLKNNMSGSFILVESNENNNKKRKFINEEIKNKKPNQNMEHEKQSIWDLCCSYLNTRTDEKKIKELCTQFIEEKDLSKASILYEKIFISKDLLKLHTYDKQKKTIQLIKSKCLEIIQSSKKNQFKSLCNLNKLYTDRLLKTPIYSVFQAISPDITENHYFCIDWDTSPVEKPSEQFTQPIERYFSEKKNIYSLLEKIGFKKISIPQIDHIHLKKGFIGCVENNKKKYIVKYQPLKSYNELLISNYVKKKCEEDISIQSLFVFPEFVFLLGDFSYFMVMPKYHCNLNSYFSLLEKKNIRFKFENFIKVLSVVIKSVLFLKSINIVHADLKLDNIVLNLDKDFNIIDARIIDFDVSLFMPVPEEIKSLCHYSLFSKVLESQKVRGTRLYICPEKKTMNFENDVYTIGILCLMVFFKMIKGYYYNLISIKMDKDESVDDLKKRVSYLSDLRKKSDQKQEKYLFTKYVFEDIDKCVPIDYSFHLECFKKMIEECITFNYTIEEIYMKYAFVLELNNQ